MSCKTENTTFFFQTRVILEWDIFHSRSQPQTVQQRWWAIYELSSGEENKDVHGCSRLHVDADNSTCYQVRKLWPSVTVLMKIAMLLNKYCMSVCKPWEKHRRWTPRGDFMILWMTFPTPWTCFHKGLMLSILLNRSITVTLVLGCSCRVSERRKLMLYSQWHTR